MEIDNECIEEVKSNLLKNKKEIQRLLLTEYIKKKSHELLMDGLISKSDLKIADIIATAIFQKEYYQAIYK